MNSQIASFFKNLHEFIEDDLGVVTLASFSENAPAKIRHIPLGDEMPSIAARICEEWNKEPGRNVYWSAGIRRGDIKDGTRGGLDDIAGMVAIVIDIDDPAAAAEWEVRAQDIGIRPSFVIITSKTPTMRCQLIFKLKEVTSDFEAWRKVARNLEAYFGADWCSKDYAHVWRVPYLTNYPSEKKRIEGGRVAEPVEMIVPAAVPPEYELEDFGDLPEAPVEKAAAQMDLEISLPQDPLRGVSQQWSNMVEIASFLPDWLAVKVCDNLPHPKGRSDLDWQIAKEMARLGRFNQADHYALYALALQTDLYADKFREKERQRPGAGVEYLARTWAKACASVVEETGYSEQAPAGQQDETPLDRWRRHVFTSDMLVNIEIEPVVYLMQPWLQKGAIHCIHGPTGQGKTHFTQHTTYALTCGAAPSPFHSPAKKKVCYVDGEMSLRTVTFRIKNLEKEYGKSDMFKYFTPLARADGVKDMLDINLQRQLDQEILINLLNDETPDVVVLDNVRTLCGGIKENDAEAWAGWNKYLVKLRTMLDCTVVWVHHDKKRGPGGKQPSGHEDEGYSGSTNAMTVTEMEISITKVQKKEMQQTYDLVGQRSRDHNGAPTEELKNLVKMTYHKNREGDLGEHEDLRLMWIHDYTKGSTRIEVVVTQAMEGMRMEISTALRQLPIAARAYVLYEGWNGQPPIRNYAEIGRILKKSRMSIKRYVDEVNSWSQMDRAQFLVRMDEAQQRITTMF